MKLYYNVKVENDVEKYRYLDMLGLDLNLPFLSHSLVIDTDLRKVTICPFLESAQEITIDEIIIRINFLFCPSYYFIPRGFNENEYREIICKGLELIGAIPKRELQVGHIYLGRCRNSDRAVWLEEGRFEYVRYKFGFTYLEKINHYEDDNGYDLFVPLSESQEPYKEYEQEKEKERNKN